MDYVLTEHALKRCIERKIQQKWVDDTINYPAKTENDDNDPTLVHALRAIPEKGFRTLRVIYNETTNPTTIVTAYFDDKVKDI